LWPKALDLCRKFPPVAQKRHTFLTNCERNSGTWSHLYVSNIRAEMQGFPFGTQPH
jgi:hypothetical protein